MEKFSPHERCGDKSIHAVLSQNLCCCHLRCFVAESIWSQFTRFCVEKNLTQIFVCGEKRTNMRYVLTIIKTGIAKTRLNSIITPPLPPQIINMIEFFSILFSFIGFFFRVNTDCNLPSIYHPTTQKAAAIMICHFQNIKILPSACLLVGHCWI